MGIATDTDETQLQALMIKALEGDAAAYRQALQIVSSRLRSYFAARLRTRPHDVEDLVQETMLAIHTKRHTYDPARPFMAWVYGIAGYKLIDNLRRQKNAPVNIEDIDAAPGTAAPQNEALNRVVSEKLIAMLPQRTQNLLSKVKLEGMSVREAANTEGMSENAAKVAIHRGIKTLAAHVQGKHT